MNQFRPAAFSQKCKEHNSEQHSITTVAIDRPEFARPRPGAAFSQKTPHPVAARSQRVQPRRAARGASG
eukprot:1341939-Lingulodinium_polyedra.AAC.1